MIYTQEHVTKLREMLAGKAPFVRVQLATLGGEDKSGIYFTISLDAVESWSNKILENSRYAKFNIYSHEHKLELFSGGSRQHKFRKCNAPTLEDIVYKLECWIASWNGTEQPKKPVKRQEAKVEIDIMNIHEVANLVVKQFAYKIIRAHEKNVDGEIRLYEVKEYRGNTANRWELIDAQTANMLKTVLDHVQKSNSDNYNKLLTLPLPQLIKFGWNCVKQN